MVLPVQGSPFVSYRRRLFAVALGLVGAIAAINAVVDPFAVLDWLRLPGFNLEKTRGHLTDQRIDKSIRLAHGRFDVMLFGTSRVATGIDPADPVFAGRRVFSAALHTTNLAELEAVFRYALDRQRPELAIVDLDLWAVNERRQRGPEFEASAFAGRHPLSVLLRRLVSWDVLRASLLTVADNRAGAEAIYRPDGSLVGPVGWADGFDHTLSFWKQLELYAFSSQEYGCFRYGADALAHLDAILSHAAARGTAVALFVSPNHAQQSELVHAMGLWPDYERFKRDVILRVAAQAQAHPELVVSLRDFSGFSPFNTEAVPVAGGVMAWYWESSHYKRALGSVMLARMLGPDATDRFPDGFGDRLVPEGLDAHLVAQRQARQDWARANPAVRRVIRGLAARSMASRPVLCGEAGSAGPGAQPRAGARL